SRKQQRDAQDLTHVNGQRLFKGHLRFFQEFNNKTQTKASDQKNAQQPPLRRMLAIPPPYHEESDEQQYIPCGLVQLCRVARYHVHEDDSRKTAVVIGYKPGKKLGGDVDMFAGDLVR